MSVYVGKPVKRYDGIGHVTGRTVYVDDVEVPGVFSIKVLHSPVHRGILKGIDTREAEKMPGVIGVISAKDVPGVNSTGGYTGQPIFVEDTICFKGERIAAVAAVDEDTAYEAIKKIKVEIEEQTPIFDPHEAIKPDALLIAREDSNLFQEFNNGDVHQVKTGDVEKGFAQADHIVEGTYTQAFHDHASIELQASTAYIDASNRLVIHGHAQCRLPYLNGLAAQFNLPLNKFRYLGGTVGGGFGGKNDIHCDNVAGVMALKTGKPVRYQMTRQEDILTTTKRGWFEISFKDGVMNYGRIVAREVRTLHDAGAPGGIGPYGTEKNSMLVTGPYNIPNIAIYGQCVYTNKPPASSMRGYTIVNGTASVELQMDKIADKLGINPWEIRMQNAWRNGDFTATQVEVKACAAVEVMQKAAELAGIDLPNHLKNMSSDRR